MRQLVRDSYNPTPGGLEYRQRQGKWKAEHAHTFFSIAELFPLPINEIKRAGLLSITDPPRPMAFKELDEEAHKYFRSKAPPSPWSIHTILLDWEAGASNIKNQIDEWIDRVNRSQAVDNGRRVNQRGSPRELILTRRLNQLATWRAHRAGLKYPDLEKLTPKVWTHPSSFRNGYKRAEQVLLDLLSGEGRELFAGK